MLLVNHGEPEGLEHDVVGDERVRADHDVAFAALDDLERGVAVFPRRAPGEQHHFRGVLQTRKDILQGGHVILNDKYLAFRESGDLNKIAQWLEVGDNVNYIGLCYEGKIHLEAIYVTDSKENVRPICECGTRMKSMGADQGVRCPTCKKRSTIQWTTVQREPPISGWVQPPYDKRRHLAKSMS